MGLVRPRQPLHAHPLEAVFLEHKSFQPSADGEGNVTTHYFCGYFCSMAPASGVRPAQIRHIYVTEKRLPGWRPGTTNTRKATARVPKLGALLAYKEINHQTACPYTRRRGVARALDNFVSLFVPKNAKKGTGLRAEFPSD